MPERGSLSQVGERIENLLQEVRSMASPPAWQRVDELIRLILELYGSGLSRTIEIAADTGAAGEAISISSPPTNWSAVCLSCTVCIPTISRPGSVRRWSAYVRIWARMAATWNWCKPTKRPEWCGCAWPAVVSCPSSTLTVKLAVETAIKEVAPELTSIEVEGLERAERPGHNGLVAIWPICRSGPRWAMRRGSRRGRQH